MKALKIFWTIEILLLLLFIGFSAIVFTSCDIAGFTLAGSKGLMKQLAYSCRNTNIISYIFGGVFLLNSLIIIYLNHKVKVE